MSGNELKAGIYRHYKGPLYLVLGIAHDANAEDLVHVSDISLRNEEYNELGERTVVVYVPLQLDGAHRGPRMAVRTLADFVEPVCPFNRAIEDGNGYAVIGHEWCGQPDCTKHPAWAQVSRFTYLGSELTQEMT